MRIRSKRIGLTRAATLMAAGLVVALLTACGSDSNSNDQARTSEGVFLDGLISGLNYRTETQEGIIGEDGKFHYREGETITLSVAGIVLGSAPAGQKLAFEEIVPAVAADSTNSMLINMARLLISLDDDGNLLNGIRINATARETIGKYLQANPLPSPEIFSDTPAFEAAMTGTDGLFEQLNAAGVFAENANDQRRSLADRFLAWFHLQDVLDLIAGKPVDHSLRPVLFIHGGAGSASQFESQAERFLANGYPRTYLAVYEYDTNTGQSPTDEAQAAQRNLQIDAIIDHLRRISGHDKVNLIGHSMGTGVSMMYLRDPNRAARIERYVNIDGAAADAPPGGVPTLALWGQYVELEVGGAENVYPPADNPVGHIEVATSAESFARIYRFFNGKEPGTIHAPVAEGDHVWLVGRANIFPQNVGAAGTTLAIYPVDPDTGMRRGETPLHTQPIGEDGRWGPFRVEKGATYEFVLMRESANNDHYFYREPFYRDNYFIRLNTSNPGTGVGALLHRSPNHTNLMISRDKELWGDQDGHNDVLTVDSVNVITPQVAPLLKRLSAIFLHDRNSDGVSNLEVPDPVFSLLPFMSGLDLYIPASSPPNGTIRIELTPRGGNGAKQVINVPNWSSEQVRTVTVQFRDYLQQ